MSTQLDICLWKLISSLSQFLYQQELFNASFFFSWFYFSYKIYLKFKLN